MTKRIEPVARRYARQTYGGVMWRRLGVAVIAVPLALRAVVSRRFIRGVLALPLAVASTVLTGILASVAVLNLAYPFRSYLGFHGNDSGGIWASTYHGAWGGPTLAGAWAVHGFAVVLLVFPALAWAIRGLLRVQSRLIAAVPAVSRAAIRTERIPAARSAPPPARRGRLEWYRVGVIAAALALVYGLARAAHGVGIGDNVLWLPRDLRSGLALAVVLAPLAGAVLTARIWWHRGLAHR